MVLNIIMLRILWVGNLGGTHWEWFISVLQLQGGLTWLDMLGQFSWIHVSEAVNLTLGFLSFVLFFFLFNVMSAFARVELCSGVQVVMAGTLRAGCLSKVLASLR